MMLRTRILAILATLAFTFALIGQAAAAVRPQGNIAIHFNPSNCLQFAITGSGFDFETAGSLVLVFTSPGFGTSRIRVNPDEDGNFLAGPFTFVEGVRAKVVTTTTVDDQDTGNPADDTVASNTLVYRVCEATPPSIVLSTDDLDCGQVIVTATGFGITPGTSYQLVAGGAARIVKAAAMSNTVSATYPLSEAGEWGNVSIRTASGGYLAATSNLGAGLSWYHVRSC